MGRFAFEKQIDMQEYFKLCNLLYEHIPRKYYEKMNIKNNKYIIVLDKEIKLYKSLIGKIYNEFSTIYKNNPITTSAFIGGIIIGILTLIQTIYSVLSYYKN